MVRMMFQIEQAHWFYTDQIACQDKSLAKISFKAFCQELFKHVPFLRDLLSKLDDVIKEFKEYKSNVPTYGAIILDPTLERCLMVQGYYSRNSWGFPKGKVNHNEAPILCAIREVREETSFDCTPLINEQDYIKKNFHGTDIKLYIVAGVDLSQKFQPATKGEIKKIDWFLIDELPDNFNDKPTGHMSKYSFFMAIPFIRDLRKWISRKKKQQQNIIGSSIMSSPLTLNNSNIFASPSTHSNKANYKVISSTPKISNQAATTKSTAVNCKRKSILDKFELNAPQQSEFTFWTSHWENAHTQLDWKGIWSEIDKELLELKMHVINSRI